MTEGITILMDMTDFLGIKESIMEKELHHPFLEYYEKGTHSATKTIKKWETKVV